MKKTANDYDFRQDFTILYPYPKCVSYKVFWKLNILGNHEAAGDFGNNK